ncbi:MAG: hypothetical protein J5732_05710 [Bacteroidaceae bacterium]|nr:hypothetical protein [Bacteroidaceae bacterium]
MDDHVNKGSLSDKDIERFLLVCLFGSRYNTIKTGRDKIVLAIRRAYRDFSRTIIKDQIEPEKPEEVKNDEYFDKRHGSKGKAARKIVCAIDKRYTKEYAKWNEDLSVATKYDLNDYDKWHENLCKEIVKERYTYGQAQKWVNMTMKYLLVIKYEPVEAIIEKLHIPLDSIIIKKALDSKHPLVKVETLGDGFSWSRISDYNRYMKIQKDFKSNLNNEIPILWEFDTWNESTGKE